ncbi:MAG: Rrf2 family transcriptional regulator [Clostridia bacterium]|nr:Rrf2 family transcriptional regulator [Clostridia bacterium]
MKFSTKAQYGLRAMIELALHHNQGPISVKNIAEQQEISEAYLEQLMRLLIKRGLVKSLRGAQGGYIIAREPAEIKVSEVINALEGPVSPVDCVKRENPAECSLFGQCVSRIVWEKVRNVIEEALDSLTLQDLRNELLSRKQSATY